MRGWRWFPGILLVAAVPACSRPRTDMVSPRPAGATERAAAPVTGSAPESDRPAAPEPTRAQEVARDVATGAAPVASPRPAGAPMERLFFDYDSDAIRVEVRGSLEAMAQWLRANPGTRIVVEGHCDERGSDEYNLALGLRRANSVRRFLVNYGVPASRIEVRSFGEERPLVQGSDESAWSQNRRAEFVVRAG